MQRFPEKDWPDTPFIDGIEWFCQPQGWALSTEKQEPQFFVSVLTDIDAQHHYCACLCFNETVAITPSKPVDDEEESLGLGSGAALILSGPPAILHHSVMYAPKCLVLVSRLNYVETFRVSPISQKNVVQALTLVYFCPIELSWHHFYCVYRKFAICT